jgi:iron complex outermembrane receptor protein
MRAIAKAFLVSSALTWAGTGFAQTPPTSEGVQKAAEADIAAGDIVVTATKREERLLDVPISVNVVGATQLERQNITSISDLSRAVPALGAGNSVRGVSTNGFARSSEAAVSVVLDGVVMGRSAINNIFDIERVEVLSGPQGMLFGKNASAGVINIVTKAPNPAGFEMIVHADVGNYKYLRDRVTVNAPLASNAALRVGMHLEQQGGYVTNTRTGRENRAYSYGARARLLWEPNDNLSVNVIGDVDKGSDNGVGTRTFAIVATPLLASRLAACGIVARLDNDQHCSEGETPITARTLAYGLSAQLDYRLAGDYVLTSITANRWRETGDFDYKGLGGDTDALNIDILSTNLAPSYVKTFSQEFRLASPVDQTVSFVAGLYASRTRTRDQIFQAGTLGLVPPPLRVGRVSQISIFQRSYAAFGQATIHATDKLSLIVGGRYTDELVEDNGMSLTPTTTPSLNSFGVIFVPALLIANVNQRVKTNNFSWRLGAQYQWTPSLMTYFTAARGYKGPAVNDSASPPLVQPIILPEIPMNYELGLKGSFFDGKMAVTLSLFNNKVKDFQTAVFVAPSAANPVPGFAQGNAPYIRTRGFDLNIFGRPAPGLSINIGAIYNRAVYSPTFLVSCNTQQVRGVGSCSAQGTTQPVSQLANTPKLRILANGEYATDLDPKLTGFIQSDLVFETHQFFSATPDPNLETGNHWLLGGRIGVRSKTGGWGVSIFGRNLLNKTYPLVFADAITAFNGGGGKSYATIPSIDWHRSFGATFDLRF